MDFTSNSRELLNLYDKAKELYPESVVLVEERGWLYALRADADKIWPWVTCGWSPMRLHPNDDLREMPTEIIHQVQIRPEDREKEIQRLKLKRFRIVVVNEVQSTLLAKGIHTQQVTLPF